MLAAMTAGGFWFWRYGVRDRGKRAFTDADSAQELPGKEPASPKLSDGVNYRPGMVTIFFGEKEVVAVDVKGERLSGREATTLWRPPSAFAVSMNPEVSINAEEFTNPAMSTNFADGLVSPPRKEAQPEMQSPGKDVPSAGAGKADVAPAEPAPKPPL